MACSRSPPASPRAPKIQQQSWDDSDTPPIDLYDPSHHSPPRSPGRVNYYDHPLNSPNIRKYDKVREKQPHCKSPSSPRHFNFPQIDFDYAVDQQQYGTPPKAPPTIHCTYQKSPTNSVKYYDRKKPPHSIVTSPKGSHSLEYGAISPKHNKKFEYYEPCSPDDDDDIAHNDDEDDNSFIEYRHSSIQYKKKKKKHYNKSPNGVFSLDEYHSNCDKRGSLVTESSGASDFSTATTARCSSGAEAEHQQQQQQQQRVSQQNRRRHAINITTNPGYQAIHNSHSTLDRTCSDSVVSSRIRKSTSDLTQASEVQSPVQQPHRRRGSSKDGLAYLASRRGSRESIKSAASNASIFSNDDIGPLAFQASARGQQRRTSNFLELPIPDHARPRVCSLPERPYNPRQSDDLYRLRTFSISKGTVVNCGDSIISRRSRSNTSMNSTTSR
uniref:CSON000949 protein n=1 Tax=Culicoides sonorensis TaxID=179676 RepID=A0A336MK16_CULSO